VGFLVGADWNLLHAVWQPHELQVWHGRYQWQHSVAEPLLVVPLFLYSL
jgi:hypothetical protein